MNVAFLCLGGNIGNREFTLNQAVEKINLEIGKVISQSNYYETEAWGVENQDKYLNQCICVETILPSNQVLKKSLEIELSLGRKRNHKETYEPRTIDIDMLFYNSDIIQTKDLAIPHPRLHLRKFVLIPLNEIAPTFVHPVLNKTIHTLRLECMDDCEVLPYK
jgi:2-amino-4-hydroxy-6-hydroxymethyldihydropteridine diphosphokinase